jgi:hypothetical protein
MIPILGFRTIWSGTTAKTNFTSSSFSAAFAPLETTDASPPAVALFFAGDSALLFPSYFLGCFLSILVVLYH